MYKLLNDIDTEPPNDDIDEMKCKFKNIAACSVK